MKVNVYTPMQQAKGSFEGGKIIEQRPIGFPQDQGAVQRVGPLFYWAWAHAKDGGSIGLHPHKGFEIMSYVVNGQVSHGDTLGTESTVGPGGAQVMQTGTGVSHREEIEGPDAEIFQIWFEPDLNEAVKRMPTYNEYAAEDFPGEDNGHIRKKTIIGEGSPIQLVADAQMWDITLGPGREYEHRIPGGYSIAALAIRGNGSWRIGDEITAFGHRDFTVLQADAAQPETVCLASGQDKVRMVVIQLPNQVDYPLYQR